MSRPSEKYRFVYRYVLGLMILVSVAAIGVIGSFYFAQRVDREAQDRVAHFHVESQMLGERLHRQSRSLLRILGYDVPDTSDLAPTEMLSISTGPDAHGILKMMAAKSDELKKLDAYYGDRDFKATLIRMEDRLRSVEYSIDHAESPDTVRRAIVSFDLAVEQLNRQHSIAADAAYPDIDTVIGRIMPYLAIVAAILIAAGAVSWVALRLLRKSIERQAAAELSLAENIEKMHHLEKLESLGRLVGGVAHDFNNLLTAILGQTGLLLDKTTDERMRHGLVQVREAGQQAASLTRQLLNFSRPQSTAVDVVDVNALIDDIGVILTRVIGDDIELKIDYGVNLSPVELDPGQLQQVIVNLAVNARDAMPDGGELSIVTEAVTVEPSHDEPVVVPAGRYTKITVTDSGVGMNEKTQERIFEPYFTTKARGQGTGLGLSTVYGVVKGTDGHVEVTSQPGGGSRFAVLLPGSTKPLNDVVSKHVTATGIVGDETVLVVEDEERIRAFLKEGLENLGYRVLLAADAEEGIDICDERHGEIDVILTDVILPGKNGLEFILEARRLQSDVTTLLMSGYTDDVLVQNGIDKSDIPLLYKPFEINEVAGLIRQQRTKSVVTDASGTKSSSVA
jgi:signal transduction histidine kinase/ActR/RegA family two-component response regulator